jgi:hypothetical protein
LFTWKSKPMRRPDAGVTSVKVMAASTS